MPQTASFPISPPGKTSGVTTKESLVKASVSPCAARSASRVVAASFRHSNTEVGVEGLITIATSTTTATFMADFCFNGLTDLTTTDRAVTLAANRGLGWMLDTSQAKEFALAHWLTLGASGGRLFVRVFDGAGNVREDIAGDVLASITTMQWNGPAKGWNAGAPMDDANFNRRQTIRVGAAVAYAQVGVIGFDGPIDLQSLRLYGLPEAAPAVLNGAPLLTGALFGSGRRELAAEVSWDLPSLAPGATSLIDVTVNGVRAGDHGRRPEPRKMDQRGLLGRRHRGAGGGF